MKSVKMMSGREIIISDEECLKIKEIITKGRGGLIGLKNGDVINLSSVETISTPELEPYFMGNPMNKNKTKVLVQGEWKDFAGEQSQIEFRIKNQKYETKMLQEV